MTKYDERYGDCERFGEALDFKGMMSIGRLEQSDEIFQNAEDLWTRFGQLCL
jgi:hypothetical protein